MTTNDDRAPTIRGKVVDENGNPVAGASVRLFPVDQPFVACVTSADGSFAIQMPGPCHDLVEAIAHGFADQGWPIPQHGTWPIPHDPMVLRLRPGAELRLRCTDANGAEIPGVAMFLSRADGGGYGFTSDQPAGELPARFALGVHTLRAFARGFQYVRREIVLAGPTDLEVRLEPAHERTVRFRIRGADAEQLQQAQCRLGLLENEHHTAFSLPSFEGRPDADGVFEIAGLPKDVPLQLRVEIPGMRAHPDPAMVWPDPRDGVVEVHFAMREQPKRTVHGRFVDEAGRGVGPLQFLVYQGHAGHQEGTTDPEGRFVVTTTLCDGEILRVWLAPGPRVVDSPTSLHRTARSRQQHVLEMPCDLPIEIPTIPSPPLDGAPSAPDPRRAT